MFGRTCYSILMLCFGCLDTREGIEFPETHTMSCPENQMEPMVESLEPQGATSEEDLEKDLKAGVLLTPETYEAEWQCALFSRPVFYRINEVTPAVFLIMTVPELTYCVSAERRSGYITIRHEEGEVDREGDHFQWCFSRVASETKGGKLVKLEVWSLTPEAEFTIALRRGME